MNITQFKKLKQKKSKYNSKKTEYNGIIFDSKKEAEYAKKLDSYIKIGAVLNYKRQVKYFYYFNAINPYNGLEFPLRARFYKADFVVTYNDGHEEIIDVKGFRTKEYKAKKKIIEYLYKIKIIEK